MSNRFTDHHHSGFPHHRSSMFAAASQPRFLHDSPTAHQGTTQASKSSADAWVNQVQLSLAIMGAEQLQSLLLQSDPSPIVDHRLGQMSLKLAVPLGADVTADGLLHFEVISCRLAEPETMPPETTVGSRFQRHRAIVNQIRCETKLQNLGLNLTLTDAIARLQYALFSSGDIQRILHLPYHGWHRSWWEMVDPNDEFSLPFQRLMRSRRYADGTVTLQYKDQFGYLPPPCFRSHSEAALIHIQRPGTPFATTLAQINQGCHALELNHAVLIYRSLPRPEYQAFRHQGVRLYHWRDRSTPSHQRHGSITVLPTTLSAAAPSTPSSVDCSRCTQSHCAMQGQADSPVTACQQFRAGPPPAPPGMVDTLDEPPPTPTPED